MKRAVVLLLLIVLCLVFVSCSNQEYKTLNTFDYFSTVITLNASVTKESDINASWEDMKVSLSAMETYLSVYIENSDIDKFNKSEPGAIVEISKLTYDVLSLAITAYTNTNGLYNPALYLLSDLWGFTDRFTSSQYAPTKPYDRQNPKEQLPEDRYVEAFLTLTDFSKVHVYALEDKYYAYKPTSSIEIDGQTYTMQLDLGGIVKGYAAAVLKLSAGNYGIEYGYISLGSSSLALLKRDTKGRSWELKLKDPCDPDSYYLSTLKKSVYVSTSGNYEQFYEIEGKRYCHIINPTTGRPIENGMLSCTLVVSSITNDLRNSSLIDAYSTALMTMSIDDAREFVKETGFTAYIAVKDGEKNKVYTNDEQVSVLANYERI